MRNKTDGLWNIDLIKSKSVNNPTIEQNLIYQNEQKMNYIITKDRTKTELAQYLHAASFSPSISTLQKAINNGNFTSWPGIHQLNFSKLIKTTIATEKGHLDQERKNLRSTKNDEELDFFPMKTEKRNNELFVHIMSIKDLNDKQKNYCD